MATYQDINILTDYLGVPFNVALDAIRRANGNVHIAADLVFRKTDRRRSTRSERAGLSQNPLALSRTSSQETTVVTSEFEYCSDRDNSDDLCRTTACDPVHVLHLPAGGSNESWEVADSPHSPLATVSLSISRLIRRATKTGDVQTKTKAPTVAPRTEGTDVVTSPCIGRAPGTELHPEDGKKNSTPCVCQEAKNSRMVQCSTCERWYHYECAHLAEDNMPTGPWYCHFEVNASTPPLDRNGSKFNELESRALYLTVKKLAPLGKGFWEKVSDRLLSDFNIRRTATSVKFDWVRNSSAIWGFDERTAVQYSERQEQERKTLLRCQISGTVMPTKIGFRAIGEGLHSSETTTEVDIRKRKPSKATWPPGKLRNPVQLVDGGHEEEDGNLALIRPRITAMKRKRATVLDDNEDNNINTGVDNDCPGVSTFKRVRSAQEATGGKFIKGVEALGNRAPTVPSASRRAVLASSHVAAWEQATNTADTNAAIAVRAPASPATLMTPSLADTGRGTTQDVIIFGTSDDSSSPTPPAEDAFLRGNVLHVVGGVDTHISHWFCCYGPAIQFQSRFEALAEHRRSVKEYLRDIEPDLDWYEGPWEGVNELLWTGDEEHQLRYMFEEA
ncbi:uncharacterized protein PV09_09039 [Verruconis gallopava]|uniref:Zinc finger PHD-type domain-containing protein n=1 Tax=Verruconis gallopava TaxID=253628 RepID=A0A0D1XAM8_9PEZI|nr:uncharacterized protein PV09_09039 [Verruconis gallopava]KIV99270.1 hypothetical protein PV09_09039 [Verruconis gallopava]